MYPGITQQLYIPLSAIKQLGSLKKQVFFRTHQLRNYYVMEYIRCFVQNYEVVIFR